MIFLPVTQKLDIRFLILYPMSKEELTVLNSVAKVCSDTIGNEINGKDQTETLINFDIQLCRSKPFLSVGSLRVFAFPGKEC